MSLKYIFHHHTGIPSSLKGSHYFILSRDESWQHTDIRHYHYKHHSEKLKTTRNKTITKNKTTNIKVKTTKLLNERLADL